MVLGIGGQDQAAGALRHGVKQDLAGQHGFAGARRANDRHERLRIEPTCQQLIQARDAGGPPVRWCG